MNKEDTQEWEEKIDKLASIPAQFSSGMYISTANAKAIAKEVEAKAYEKGCRETVEKEIKYWKDVYDAYPIRENINLHDTVARNFARIEVERLEKIINH